jgi:hypothetical protein
MSKMLNNVHIFIMILSTSDITHIVFLDKLLIVPKTYAI